MTFFEDGSAYRYLAEGVGSGAINVGWLDVEHVFAAGPVPSAFVDRLLVRCRSPLLRTRGFHRCNLCEPAGSVGVASGVVVESAGGDFVVGGAEIRVLAENGVCFAAPDMVIHYVVEHGYRPPDAFVEAILGSVGAGSTGR